MRFWARAAVTRNARVTPTRDTYSLSIDESQPTMHMHATGWAASAPTEPPTNAAGASARPSLACVPEDDSQFCSPMHPCWGRA